MASFLRPISRGKAETLVAELLRRVRDDNADLTTLLVVAEVGMFGSYLDPDVTELGDVDLTLTLTARAGTNKPGVRQRPTLRAAIRHLLRGVALARDGGPATVAGARSHT